MSQISDKSVTADAARGGGVRARTVVVLYSVLLAAFAVAVAALDGSRPHHGSPMLAAALVAVSACGYLLSQTIWSRVSALLDVTVALALIALAFSGPLVAFAVLVAPDVLRLAHRRRAFLNAGLLANLVSHLAEILAGSVVLGLLATRAPLTEGLMLLAAGTAMAIANYGFARWLFAAILDGARPLALVRREFVPQLPLEMGMILAAVVCSLTIPMIGIPALMLFAFAAYVPQASAAALLSAPSVARLSVDTAAAVYRAAIGDELALGHRERRSVEATESLVETGAIHGAPRDLHHALIDAVIVSRCRQHPAEQGWKATIGAQVVLVARHWAQLTAEATPALSHPEALCALLDGDLATDAPDALRAAARIIARERALTTEVAGVPRLHRLPLPRRARHGLLPGALTPLAG